MGLARLLLIAGLVGNGGPALARSEVSGKARLTFASAVQDYRAYVTPICAGDLVRTYTSHNLGRDSKFVRSLKGTELEPVYRQAVRDKATEVARTVYHCEGPPPPPPPLPPAASVAPSTSSPTAPSILAPVALPEPLARRRLAITRAQERLRRQADDMPGFFDAADAAFETFVDMRDNLLALRERP